MILPNIEAQGARSRRVVGWSSFVLGIAVAAWLVLGTAPTWWILVLLPIFLSAGLGIFQARHLTCVAFAARGVCDLGKGIEKVGDEETLRTMKRQARRVWRSAWIFAVGMTLLTLAVKQLVS